MQRTSYFWYLMLAVFLVIPVVILFAIQVIHAAFESPLLTALVAASGTAAVLLQAVRSWASFQEIVSCDRHWYSARYPGKVRARTVICIHCGNQDVRMRPMPHPTYTRVHYCSGCGQTLFYSPEQS